MTARALSTPLLNWLRSSRTRRQLAKGLGGGDKPNDTYLRMATVALDFMASDALNQPHTDPTALWSATPALDVDALEALRLLFDVMERVDGQADIGGMVSITSGLWKDMVRPAIRKVRSALPARLAAALAAEPKPELFTREEVDAMILEAIDETEAGEDW